MDRTTVTLVKISLFSLLIVTSLTPTATAIAAAPSMVEFEYDGQRRQGIPIMDFPDETIVLGRDGQLHSIRGEEREQLQSITSTYSPATVMEMRSQLQQEFGRGFEVLATQHFLVVQPRGRGEKWAEIFEQSHRSFINYMSRRGIKIRRGRFPMVAIVMPDETAMYAELKRMNVDVKRVAGIYARESNRVITHDGGHLRYIGATLRHEAAHQSAYNYNVHSRVVITPRWVTEGIGQMFEPETMVDTRPGLTPRDRANQDSLAVLRRDYGADFNSGFSEAVRDLVGNDGMFHQSQTIDKAYSVAWAMMFYLAEREPDAYAKVLAGTNARGTYQPYDRFTRLSDFERWVGTDIDQFSTKVAWFLKSL